MTDYAIWTPKFDGDAPPNWKAGMKWANMSTLACTTMQDHGFNPHWQKGDVYHLQPEALPAFDYSTWASQGRANADKLPSGVAEALGPERDWADEVIDALNDVWTSSDEPVSNIIRKMCRPISNDTVTDEVIEAAKLAFEFAQAVNNLLTPLKSEWQQAGMWTEYDEKVFQMRPQVTLALEAALKGHTQ